MSWLGSAFGSAVNPYLTYIKVGAGIVVLLVIGGLYWWGSHESAKVDTLNTKIGVLDKTVADDKVILGAYKGALDNWEKAFAQFQKVAQRQADVAHAAVAEKDALDAQLKDLNDRLKTNPVSTATVVTGNVAHLVCLLNAASRGAGDGCPEAAPSPSNAPAAGTP
jgi:hypothetical protein